MRTWKWGLPESGSWIVNSRSPIIYLLTMSSARISGIQGIRFTSGRVMNLIKVLLLLAVAGAA